MTDQIHLCPFKYRDANCGYTGPLPSCDKTLEHCKAHFPEGEALPFGGYPALKEKESDESKMQRLRNSVIVDNLIEVEIKLIRTNKNYWFADIDETRSESDEARWLPFLQYNCGVIRFDGPRFATEEDCKQFIRDEILGVNELR